MIPNFYYEINLFQSKITRNEKVNYQFANVCFMIDNCRVAFGMTIFDILKCCTYSQLISVCCAVYNKANLRDLIAATGLVISNWIQIVNSSDRVTVKFYGWPLKTIGHFFYTTSSFVHHFKSIGEFKLDLQSRNAQFGSKLVLCYPVWPWNLIYDLGKQ